MSDAKEPAERKSLPCGCQVDASRDFLGRVVGTVILKGETCSHTLHTEGSVIVMPGREHARSE